MGASLDPYARLAKARQVIAAVSSSLLTALSEPFAQKIGEDLSASNAVPIAQVSIALGAWTILAVVIVPLIESFGFYRRLILRRQFLEGSWVAVATPMPSNKLQSEPTMEIMELEWTGEQLRMTGTVYSLKGARLARFESKFLMIDWPIIYNQVEDLDAGFDQKKEGIGELHFHATQGQCMTYSGFFGHVGIANDHSLEGVRLNARERALLADITKRSQLLRDKYGEITQCQNHTKDTDILVAPPSAVDRGQRDEE